MAEIWSTVADNLNRLNGVTGQLSRLDKEVGSDDDGAQGRGDMKRLRDEGQDLIKKTKALLTQPYDRTQRPKHDKLQAQLTELSTQFEKVAKVTINKEMERRLSQVPPPSSSSKNSYESSSTSQSRPPQQQQTQIQQKPSNPNDLILQERNNEIKDLEKELVQLSEVFVDVMKLTKEQGEDLHTVQNNTSSADQHVVVGVSELKQASKYQCSYRKKMVVLAAIVLIIIVVIIIIAVVVSKKNKNN